MSPHASRGARQKPAPPFPPLPLVLAVVVVEPELPPVVVVPCCPPVEPPLLVPHAAAATPKRATMATGASLRMILRWLVRSRMVMVLTHLYPMAAFEKPMRIRPERLE